MKRARWLKGRRLGNYQLTVRQDVILISHVVFSWPVAVLAAGLAWPVLVIVIAEYVPELEHPFDSFGESVPVSVFQFLLLFAPPILFAIPLLWRGRHIRNNALRRMGFPICVKCEYDLKGLTGNASVDKCPECGAVIADMPPVATTEH